MYRPNQPHGVATSSVPTPLKEDKTSSVTKTVTAIRRNGTQKMHLLNEALARARMYEMWNEEHRYKRRTRSSLEVLRSVRRRRRSELN